MSSLPFEKPSELLWPEKALRQKHTGGAVGMYENGAGDFGGTLTLPATGRTSRILSSPPLFTPPLRGPVLQQPQPAFDFGLDVSLLPPTPGHSP